MAADERKDERTETELSTPASQQDVPQNNAPKAAKNKACPFCGQPFTTSSLGRHLDLYIKPKNPKAPDGIHNVEEIAKMRGGITRRQPKAGLRSGAIVDANGWLGNGGGSQEPASPTRSSAKLAPRPEARRAEDSPSGSPAEVVDEGKVRPFFSTPKWHATGVIPNLPPRAPSRNTTATSQTQTGQAQRVQDMRRDASTGGKFQRPERPERPEYDSEAIAKLQEAAEVGSAAELALREVLSSLQAVKRTAESEQLFDGVDFMALSFPGLCLAILPPPTALFSLTPFSGGDSWTTTPPGQRQLETLDRFVHERVKEVRNGNEANLPAQIAFKYSMHLKDAYEHWQMLPDVERTSVWTLETLRAFSTARNATRQAQDRLETANTRIRHLEAEFDRISRCQLPREYLLHPPNTMPFPATATKELSAARLTSGAAEADFNPDTLLEKWRARVRANKRRAAAAVPSAEASRDVADERNLNCDLESDMLLTGSVWGINGPMPRATNRAADYNAGYANYETRPKPGTIVAVDDDDGDMDRDDDPGRFRKYVDRADKALVGRRQPYVSAESSEESSGGAKNANGKRPLAPLCGWNGPGSGPKVYKAQWTPAVESRLGG